jgi:hypothetical protein
MATTTNFSWTTPDNTGYVKDGALAIRTLGSAIDSSMALLKGGTTGQVLTKASGFGMDFTWASPNTTPRIGQVVTATSTTSTTTSSSGYVDVTGLSVTITPTSSSSKILVMAQCQFATNQGTTVYSTGQTRLLRDSTTLYNNLLGSYWSSGTNPQYLVNYVTPFIQWVDSPATTSATTYKLQMNLILAGVNLTANGSTNAQITAMEILV